MIGKVVDRRVNTMLDFVIVSLEKGMGCVPQGVSSRNFFFLQEAIFIMTCQGGNSAKVKIIEIPKDLKVLLI